MVTIETERLRLRALEATDADQMFAYARDPVLTSYLDWEPHDCVEHTVLYLMCAVDACERGELLDWGVVRKEDDRLIGTCGFPRKDLDHGWGELGYVIGREYWGQGYGTECARAVRDYGFQNLGLNRIEAYCVCGNHASSRVLEKLNMTCEGTLTQRFKRDDEHLDVLLYASMAQRPVLDGGS